MDWRHRQPIPMPASTQRSTPNFIVEPFMQQEVGMSFAIHPLTAGDEDFLWQILFYAAHAHEEADRTVADLAGDPVLANYVAGWGRPGDLGFLAIETDRGIPLGAAWVRVPSAQQQTYSYADDRTPELAIAVLPERTGQGIGTALLKALLTAAEGRYPAIILSVRQGNRAFYLYERFGFKVTRELTNRVGGRSFEMILTFDKGG